MDSRNKNAKKVPRSHPIGPAAMSARRWEKTWSSGHPAEAVLRAVSLFCSSWPCLIFSDNHHLLSHQTASLFISLGFGCLRVEPGEGGSESSLSQLILTPYAALLKGICRSSGLLSHNAGLGVAAFRI